MLLFRVVVGVQRMLAGVVVDQCGSMSSGQSCRQVRKFSVFSLSLLLLFSAYGTNDPCKHTSFQAPRNDFHTNAHINTSSKLQPWVLLLVFHKMGSFAILLAILHRNKRQPGGRCRGNKKKSTLQSQIEPCVWGVKRSRNPYKIKT